MRHKILLTTLFAALAYMLVQTASSFRHSAAQDRLVTDYASNQTSENRRALASWNDKIVSRRYLFCWLTVANVVAIIIYLALHDRKRLA
jgi:hypothetical protein